MLLCLKDETEITGLLPAKDFKCMLYYNAATADLCPVESTGKWKVTKDKV